MRILKIIDFYPAFLSAFSLEEAEGYNPEQNVARGFIPRRLPALFLLFVGAYRGTPICS